MFSKITFQMKITEKIHHLLNSRVCSIQEEEQMQKQTFSGARIGFLETIYISLYLREAVAGWILMKQIQI